MRQIIIEMPDNAKFHPANSAMFPHIYTTDERGNRVNIVVFVHLSHEVERKIEEQFK